MKRKIYWVPQDEQSSVPMGTVEDDYPGMSAEEVEARATEELLAQCGEPEQRVAILAGQIAIDDEPSRCME